MCKDKDIQLKALDYFLRHVSIGYEDHIQASVLRSAILQLETRTRQAAEANRLIDKIRQNAYRYEWLRTWPHGVLAAERLFGEFYGDRLDEEVDLAIKENNK